MHQSQHRPGKLGLCVVAGFAIVANEAARYALTTGEVAAGDGIRQADDGSLWRVIDVDNLDNARGWLWLDILGPIRNSYAENQFEAEIKQVFIDLWVGQLEAAHRDINVSGMAHLGSTDLMLRHMHADGLAVPRTPEATFPDKAFRYLYRAWKGRNYAGRGFAWLETLLQIIWPGAWTIDQMCQRATEDYPTALAPRTVIGDADSDWYLTSRILITISADTETGEALSALSPVLRATMPARFVPSFAVGIGGDSHIIMASVGEAGMIFFDAGIAADPVIADALLTTDDIPILTTDIEPIEVW